MNMIKELPQYKKVINIKSNKNARNPYADYYFRQIWDIDEVESPLKLIWNRISYLESCDYEYGRPSLVVMSPREFLDLVPVPSQSEEYKLDDIRMWLDDNNRTLNILNNGPYLIVKNGYIISHEGRHRAIVLEERDITEMAVLVYDMDYVDMNWHDVEPELANKLTL